jgi:serine protease Do
VGEIPEVLRVHLRLEEGEGVLVEQVVPGSLAGRMGLRRHDVIRTLNDVKVDSAADIIAQLARLPDGGQITLKIIRRGEPMTLVGTR